jgi:ribosome-associated protein
MSFTVPSGELELRASRASGPGGQHVNKAATRIEVVWDVAASPTLSDTQRRLILTRLANRIDKEGKLHVVSDEHRSQWRNREAATARLETLVHDALKPRKRRRKTKPSRAAREKRLREKRERADKKRRRGPAGLDE